MKPQCLQLYELLVVLVLLVLTPLFELLVWHFQSNLVRITLNEI